MQHLEEMCLAELRTACSKSTLTKQKRLSELLYCSKITWNYGWSRYFFYCFLQFAVLRDENVQTCISYKRVFRNPFILILFKFFFRFEKYNSSCLLDRFALVLDKQALPETHFEAVSLAFVQNAHDYCSVCLEFLALKSETTRVADEPVVILWFAVKVFGMHE